LIIPLLLVLLASACSREAETGRVVEISTPEAALAPSPVFTASPEPSTGLPGSTPGSTEPVQGGLTEEELTGVPRPGDLPPEKMSYEEYKRINSDVIGWLAIPGTVIEYPVLRYSDNEFYLGRDVYKEENSHGSIFMDFRNADELQQRHIILYGHNMQNGTMFHGLMNYKQKDFFDENRLIKFKWDGVETEWEIYLAYLIPPNQIYHINTRFGDAQNFADVMNDTIEYAKTVTPSNMLEDVVIKPTDQVLTLSTCSYEYDGSFFAVCARRIK
jgi:sortase B